MLINKPGIYRGTIQKSGLEEKDSGTVFFNGEFLLTQEKTANGWEDLDGNYTITAYLCVINKNGSIGEINYNAIRDCLGWDGLSLTTLQRDDWGDAKCQVTVIKDTYNGKTSLKVKGLWPFDYEGSGVKQADAGAIQSLDAKYGPMLRALAGGKNPTTAAKTTTKPKTDASGLGGDKIAWATFKAKVDTFNEENPADAYSDDDRKRVFKDLVNEFALGINTEVSKMNAGHWAKFKKELEKDFMAATRSMCPI